MMPNRRLARYGLCADLEPADCEALLDRLVPEPRALLTEPLDWDAEQMKAPATYIRTNHDRVIRPKDQLRMARSVPNIHAVELECGHAYPVVYPEQLVAILSGLL